MKLAFLLILVALTPGIAWADVWTLTPISTLVQNPERFDGRPVAIKGTVQAFIEMKSPHKLRDRWNPYHVAVICQERSCVPVDFNWGDFPIQEGTTISIGGTFTASKQVGANIVHEEITPSCIALAPPLTLSCHRHVAMSS